MRKISDRQVMTLLRKVQRCVLRNFDKGDILIGLHRDNDGVWFNCSFKICSDNYVWGECYRHLSYDENRKSIDKFIEYIDNYQN